MIDRVTKNAILYCVLDNRIKDGLFPIIEKCVYIVDDINNNYESAEDLHNNCFSTRIYSDCWRDYEV